jgi:hypothetical protein
MLAKVYALIQAEVFKADAYPVSISEQKSANADEDEVPAPGLDAHQGGQDGL